jgi:hypothetical protein
LDKITGEWLAKIKGKTKQLELLGRFEDEKDAARAYNKKASEINKEREEEYQQKVGVYEAKDEAFAKQDNALLFAAFAESISNVPADNAEALSKETLLGKPTKPANYHRFELNHFH